MASIGDAIVSCKFSGIVQSIREVGEGNRSQTLAKIRWESLDPRQRLEESVLQGKHAIRWAVQPLDGMLLRSGLPIFSSIQGVLLPPVEDLDFGLMQLQAYLPDVSVYEGSKESSLQYYHGKTGLG